MGLKQKNLKAFTIVFTEAGREYPESRLWSHEENAIQHGIKQGLPFYLKEYTLNIRREYSITKEGKKIPRELGKFLYE